jgi:acyl-[acyl-carrier-protein] desaturase
MREVEMTTQHLISDGFDIGTGRSKKFRVYKFSGASTMFLIIELAQMAKNME